ncbi:MAG: iron-sulfur cluster assembly accessory protein [Nitrososphaerota archaeon]|jgi:iron-sulfur cluster assembly protein|nr:iron-sulfur cluster assembly accessory protein [Nitrososphaerota archaeon]
MSGEAAKTLQPVLDITENAASELKSYLTKQGKPTAGLRVFVSAGGCSGLSYGMVPEENAGDDDYVITQYGAKLIVDRSSMPFIAGSVIDFQADKLMGGGFVVKNPNAVSTCGCGESFKTE